MANLIYAGRLCQFAVPSDASTFINSNDCCIGNLQGSKFAIGEAVSLPISPWHNSLKSYVLVICEEGEAPDRPGSQMTWSTNHTLGETLEYIGM